MKMYIAVAIALMFAGGALATGASQNTTYVTGWVSGTPSLTIWCGQGGHNYAPIGDPDDYDSEDGWAFSGEPECAPTDVAFGTEDDSGVGGAAFCVTGTINGRDCGQHLGHVMLVETDDTAGTPYVEIRAETCGDDQPDCTTSENTGPLVVGAGCGEAEMTIPDNMARHWQSPIEAPTYLVWARIAAVHVDESSGDPCLGGSGTISANF